MSTPEERARFAKSCELADILWKAGARPGDEISEAAWEKAHEALLAFRAIDGRGGATKPSADTRAQVMSLLVMKARTAGQA